MNIPTYENIERNRDMKEVASHIGVILFALIISAQVLCTGCEKKPESINPGLYAVEYQLNTENQELMLSMVVKYTPDYEFEAAQLINRKPMMRIRGKYRIEDGKLHSFEKTRSIFEPEWSDWSDWEPEEPSSVRVRDITKDSYQYYLEFPSDAERKKYAQLGLNEGWYTYRRFEEGAKIQ